MFTTLPKQAESVIDWDWSHYEPFAEELIQRELSAETLEQWLLDWSALGDLLDEVFSRLSVALTVDTTDKEAQQRHTNFLDQVYPHIAPTEDKLNRKLVDSGLEPEGFEVPLTYIREQIALFRPENVALHAESNKLGTEYDKIIGAQTVEWEGKEITLTQLSPVYQETDRARREEAFRLTLSRQLQDVPALDEIWAKFMDIRKQIAANADCADYREYVWREKMRLDYTPEDAETFHRAIEETVVPVVKKLNENLKQQLGVETLRPWDLMVDPLGRDPLRPYQSVEELINKAEGIFNQVDPQLGGYFKTMSDEKLLDLDNRMGKAPGGYCTGFPVAKRPFIFMNAVGVHDDVQTLLHEAGHAFHVFESSHLKYHQQRGFATLPMEFAEVGSMAMELIASPYLSEEHGGYYTDADANRARTEHLTSILRLWAYIAQVDAFQHWIYTHHEEATNPANCDAKWLELWERFMPGVDYSGVEDAIKYRWRRQLHIFQLPFYYIEYGLAQLGAVQVWANSLKDADQALRDYRHALSLGATRRLPQLFEAAGARLAFDSATFGEAVNLIENTLATLDA